MRRFSFLPILAATALSAHAQDVTLRVHHFMPGPAVLPAQFLSGWEADIEAASEGRIEVEIFHSMSLGGTPSELYDQAVDGAVDIILTLPGYTPGRFPSTEVFELPFYIKNTRLASEALFQLIDEDLADTEFEETKILAAWVHGPGVLHTKSPVSSMDDLVGLELRGPTRLATQTIAALGATPVGMPLPAIPENLSKGVIDGAVVPWEITPSIRLQELAGNHLEIGGNPALYTATFILAMNWDSYENMSSELRKLLDDLTGISLSRTASSIVHDADVVSSQIVEESGANITTLSESEVERWKRTALPVKSNWIDEVSGLGLDGEALIARANDLMLAVEQSR